MKAAAVVIAILAAAAGCGGSDGASTDNFVGTWVFDEEKVNGSCAGMPIGEQDLAGKTLTLTKLAGGKIQSELLENCKLTFTVNGNTATADAGQKCTIPFGMLQPMVEVSLWTLVTDDGKAMTTEQKGTAIGGSCTVMGSGKLSRQAMQ